MAHIALYRLWRPQSFGELVGQNPIVRTLQNSLKEGRLSHAYLFSGPRGTGKTSAAKILAKAVNCERGPAPEPCNECPACIRITEGSVIDVVEIDAASNRGVEEIRDIRDKVKYAPTEVRRKVYIIDEVHMLTTEAFNALLKTLEEPPAHVMFILATTEPHRLPATIISRCQRFDFRRVSLDEQVERLRFICSREGIQVDEDALQYIARLSEGGMRDALSLLDQIVSYSGGRVTYEEAVSVTGGVASDQFEQLAQAVKDKDAGRALELIQGLMQDGKSADKCMESLIHYYRDLLMIRMIPDSRAVTERILDIGRFRKIAEAFSNEEMFTWLDTLNRYHADMKYSVQPQTLLEVAVLKLCTSARRDGAVHEASAAVHAQADPVELAELRNAISRLERQVQQLVRNPGTSAPAPAAASSTPAAVRSGGPSGTAPLKKSGVRMEGYLQGKDSPLFQQVKLKWNQILAQVKDQKITIHAWLKDGEPVSFHQDTVLLAFNSTMHRETTEKPANRQLIEQVMSAVLGHPAKLATVMKKDWTDAGAEAKAPAAEELRLEPEESDAPPEEWIKEAIDLFGPDLVEIKDDGKEDA